jgi:hypothetical protein
VAEAEVDLIRLGFRDMGALSPAGEGNIEGELLLGLACADLERDNEAGNGSVPAGGGCRRAGPDDNGSRDCLSWRTAAELMVEETLDELPDGVCDGALERVDLVDAPELDGGGNWKTEAACWGVADNSSGGVGEANPGALLFDRFRVTRGRTGAPVGSDSIEADWWMTGGDTGVLGSPARGLEDATIGISMFWTFRVERTSPSLPIGRPGLPSMLRLGVDNSLGDKAEGNRDGMPGPNWGGLSAADLGSSSSDPCTLDDDGDCFRTVGARGGKAQLSGLAVSPSSSPLSTARAFLAATRSLVDNTGGECVAGGVELSPRSAAKGRAGDMRKGSGATVELSSNNRRREDGNRAGCVGLRVGIDEKEISSD